MPGTLFEQNKEIKAKLKLVRENFNANFKEMRNAMKIFHPIYGLVPRILINLKQYENQPADPQNIRNLMVKHPEIGNVPVIPGLDSKKYNVEEEMKSAETASFKSHIVTISAHYEKFVNDLIEEKLNCMDNMWVFQRCNKFDHRWITKTINEGIV